MAMTDYLAQFNRLKSLMNAYMINTITKLTELKDRVNEHVLAKGNVHDLEPSDIGLGNVPDWLPATTDQAKSGLSNSAFMTPRRVVDYTDENVFKVIGGAFKDAADKL